jgi:ketosteroid isomerase-like protein
MKRIAVFVILILLCGLSPRPALAQNSPDIEKAITDLEHKWADAFVNTDTDGKVTGKDTLLANLKGGKWEHNGISDVKVTVFGHVAIATGAWTGKGIDGDGSKIDRRERWTDTWAACPEASGNA